MSHRSVSTRSLVVLLVSSIWGLACSDETAETPQVQRDHAPLCGDPADAGQPPEPNSPDAAPAVPHFDCQVRLSKLSYDSPGADNAEFIELRVEGTVDSAGQRATLGDCGLEQIALLNGGDATCASYRQIPVATLAVPADGYFVLCNVESQAALGASCDLTNWGTSRLSNGWLQNGPNDVVGLVGPSPTYYAYEGVPPQCSATSWHELPADTGEVIDGVDDVIAACGDQHLRLSLAQARLRAPAQCPLAAVSDGGASTLSDPADPNNPTDSTNGSSHPLLPSSSPSPDGGQGGHVELLDASVSQPSGITMHPEAAAPPPLWHNYGTPSDAGPLSSAAPPLAASCQITPRYAPCSYGALFGLMLVTLTTARRRKAL